MQIAKRAKVIPSATMTINGIAIQKKKEGLPVYNFATGDPVIANHPLIIDEAIRVVGSGKSPYPAVSGIPELREAACNWMNNTYKTHYQTSQSVVTCGGKFAIYAIVQALLNPKDQAFIIAPYWVSYPGIIELAESKPIAIETEVENGWKISVSQLKKRWRPGVKLLILNNGCNPTGALYKKEELFEILKFCQMHNMMVLSDEVYSELVFDDTPYISCGSFPEFSDCVVVVQSCSKNFAMAGWRVGFAFGSKQLIEAIITIQGQSTTGTSIQSQQVALAAILNAESITSYVREELLKRRSIFLELYRDLFHQEVEPQDSALYFFRPLSDFGASDLDSVTFCKKVLEEGGVALVPGLAFGKDGYVRFAFSEPEDEIVNGLNALAKIFR